MKNFSTFSGCMLFVVLFCSAANAADGEITWVPLGPNGYITIEK